ncbi:MAG TPA: tRNA adenosine(34) deaminase TadA [Actinomycetota bacterium]|nr:tRNA adenosine(34) deaminase TadA [Actinomycetota bacterium]
MTREGRPRPDSGLREGRPRPDSGLRDEGFMRLALDEARAAREHDDVPIGAVVVHEGEVLAAARNERELRGDPTAHAEVLALRAAAEALGTWRLGGATVYVTLEPCPMCAGALVLARVARLVYGPQDPRAGAAYSLYNVVQDPRLNHSMEVTAGVLEEECAEVLRGFFQGRRAR